VTAPLTRIRIPLGGLKEAAQATQEVLCPSSIELPRINYDHYAGWRPYRYVWGTGQTVPGNFIDNITKIELGRQQRAQTRTWHEDSCYPGEPVCLHRPGGAAEDDGVLLSIVLDPGSNDRSCLSWMRRHWRNVPGRPCRITSPSASTAIIFPDSAHPDAGAESSVRSWAGR
jgi:carotenoid cleavage dioxygenase-like enzyme